MIASLDIINSNSNLSYQGWYDIGRRFECVFSVDENIMILINTMAEVDNQRLLQVLDQWFSTSVPRHTTIFGLFLYLIVPQNLSQLKKVGKYIIWILEKNKPCVLTKKP
jgi:hypothetical protein